MAQEMHRDAVISADGVHRYSLTRYWDYGPPVVFVMLNPSTADGMVDDPTIRRCVGFARDWGFPGLVVVNLFTVRAADPADLVLAVKAGKFGSDERATRDEHIRSAFAQSSSGPIAAWGAHKLASDERAGVMSLCPADRHWSHLGVTSKGAPKHPLYLKKSTARQEWR
jgi:hypothetical protein